MIMSSIYCSFHHAIFLVLVFLQQVTHGAIQFTAYEELRKVMVNYRSGENKMNLSADNLLVSHSQLILILSFLAT